MENQTKKIKRPNGTISYQAEGFALGRISDEFFGAYPVKQFTTASKKQLIQEVSESIKNGSLWTGETPVIGEIKGALMAIRKTTILEIDGKMFTNVETQRKCFGALDAMDQEFLSDCLIQN